MKFLNDSECPAELFRGELQPGTMHTSLLARMRYRLSRTGDKWILTALALDDKDTLTDIRREQIEDDYGIIEPDLPFPRVATDVICLADAQSYSGPTGIINVKLTAGPYAMCIRVYGERTWERRAGGDFMISPPAPIEQLPITFQYAFGGKAPASHGDLPWMANPLGKGFYLSAQDAAGHPLPNIEDPDHPITQWSDRPEPIGFAPYPSTWSLRQLDTTTIDSEHGGLTMHPEEGMFDRAHPRLSGKRLQPGDPVAITGTSIAPKVAFTVPQCPFEMELRLGNEHWRRAMDLEEILIDLRRETVDMTYRKLCKYSFMPHQVRTTILRLRPQTA